MYDKFDSGRFIEAKTTWPYRVIVNYLSYHTANEWCRIKWDKDSYSYDPTSIWQSRLRDDSGLTKPSFYFLNYEDAVEFSLVWGTE